MSRPVPLALIALLFASVVFGASPALARDQIRIVGSSTVFPFSTMVAERFGKSRAFRTPVVESTGSGGGLKLFCAGVGPRHPDIANASRRIKRSEIEACAANGVGEIVEIKIGYDGIVLANAKGGADFALTLRQIFQALAAQVPLDGALVENPYQNWSDIDPALPDLAIEVLGPPPTSGTRDAFVEFAMRAGAKTFPLLNALHDRDGPQAFHAISDRMREDGRFVEAGENDNLIVQKLEVNPGALGIFGFSFLDQNGDKVKGAHVGGVIPSFENIAEGAYGISRSLFFYVKGAHVGAIPGLVEFVGEFTSERAAGEDGYLSDKGLIPLADDERLTYSRDGAAMKPLGDL